MAGSLHAQLALLALLLAAGVVRAPGPNSTTVWLGPSANRTTLRQQYSRLEPLALQSAAIVEIREYSAAELDALVAATVRAAPPALRGAAVAFERHAASGLPFAPSAFRTAASRWPVGSGSLGVFQPGQRTRTRVESENRLSEQRAAGER